MKFTDGLLESIGAWQRGWNEDQSRRVILGEALKDACASLPPEYRSVNKRCYRKRFLHKGELAPIIMGQGMSEGITSWTTDRKYAEQFKGLLRSDAVTAAVLICEPEEALVIVNIESLWASNEFVSAAQDFKSRGGNNSDALFNFRDMQGEVVLDSSIDRGHIVAFSGISSPFDELCDSQGIPGESRAALYRSLIAAGIYVDEPRYTGEGGAERVIEKTIKNMLERVRLAKSCSV